MQSGLTGAQVAERVAAGRTNRVPTRSSRSLGAIVRANVLTWFNGLIGSLFVIMLIVGPIQDALFGFVIIFNSLIGIVQEWRAKRTLDSLAIVGEARPRVRRDGAEVQVRTGDIVLDDVILLGPGEKIPVDGAVLESTALEVDESLLTGESDPVRKDVGDEALSGSFVVAGQGAMRAERVGADAHAAQLAAEAQEFTLVRSELRDGIAQIIKYLTYLLVPAGILQIIVQTAIAGGLRNGISRTVAGIVPMVPEGLVLLTSVAFAVGVVRLGRRNCLVQELPAIEGLARVDTVCLDKTGTLTEGGMRLAGIEPLAAEATEAQVREVLGALGALEERPNATMLAIIEACPAPVASWSAQTVAAFSSARKWSGATFADGRGTWLIGAPDILGAGTYAAERAERVGAGGLRVLLLANSPKELSAEGANSTADMDPRPIALITLEQRIRDDAAPTLAYFERQKVHLKVISGDNAVSVGAVAQTLGLPGAEHPVDAGGLTPGFADDFAAEIADNSVFGRVTPRQKQQMVLALQGRGRTVAMTGDGVNDVLALKNADIGIAMGAGSGAARAVAQIVLLDERFATLPSVVAEGRRVVGNIERVSNLFLVKSFESFLLVVLTGIGRLPYPFLPRHSTLIGALTIGIPSFFLALAPNLARARTGFVKRVLRFAIPAGLVNGVAAFVSYYLARLAPGASLPTEQTSAMITLFTASLAVLLLVARPYVWWKAVLVGTMAALFILVTALPLGRHFFQLQFGAWQQTVLSFAVAAVAAVVLEILWRWSRARDAETTRTEEITRTEEPAL
ncbi:HAD-IC family P-type ATPase [Actinospica sp. MGRD01-02]|uniref:HAD-IC family P-type ATPase n=1 Tax=Actinospica acidithermotolerans TaxID=2828514 RepID=A0A941EAG2_9ACTN|nr:HAD-IC family P-type ATPase [Actinospica acidithermotolerans]